MARSVLRRWKRIYHFLFVKHLIFSYSFSVAVAAVGEEEGPPEIRSSSSSSPPCKVQNPESGEGVERYSCARYLAWPRLAKRELPSVGYLAWRTLPEDVNPALGEVFEASRGPTL